MSTALAPADLRTLLVFPPQGHPTQPYLALPSLKAWLAQHEFTDCTVWDLNLEAYDHLVSGPRLERALERIRARAERSGLLDRPALEGEDIARYRLVADALATGPYVAAHVDEAKAAIRDPAQFYDRGRYLWAMQTFEAGLKLASAEYHPSLLTAHNYTQSTSIDSTADLFAGVDSPDENMFREFYLEHALPRIERELPDILGISVTYGSQMVPALTLASEVKRRWPGIHITLGGGMLAYVGQRLSHAAPLFERCDSIIVYEGERPLLELARAVAAAGGVTRADRASANGSSNGAGGAANGAGGTPVGHAVSAPDLSGVSNLAYRGADGRAATNGELTPLPIDELPTPDFGDLPLDQYFSGELVLPIAPARGCYYEKCGFCTLYTAIGPTFRERSVDKLVEDLAVLTERHDTKFFYFIMDDLPPLMAKRIPPAFEAAGLDVLWWCDARMEARIFHPESLADLYRAGCRKLMFGFEAGSQRLLDLVEKGTDLSEAETVMRDAHEAGINATLYTMVGLPTETREEADLTRAFVVRNADCIGEISLQMFNLDMVSPMYREPARFGIARVVDDPRDLPPGEAPEQDLARYLEHESVSGMTRDEVREAFLSILGAASDALPALRGDNFTYYRYKSHIFLYLCRDGRDAFRVDHPPALRAERPQKVLRSADLPPRVALRADASLTPLPFPYGETLDRIERSWSDPTPLGGVARSSSPVDEDVAPLARRPGAVAFLGAEHRLVEIGADAARLLEHAASEGTDQALDLLGDEHRTAAGALLARGLDLGLIVPAGAE